MKLGWADYATVQAYCGNQSGNKLTSNSSGNALPQSSQLAEPLWTDSGPKSGISVHELTSTLNNNNKKAQAGNEWLNSLPKFLQARKKPPQSSMTTHNMPLNSICTNHFHSLTHGSDT